MLTLQEHREGKKYQINMNMSNHGKTADVSDGVHYTQKNEFPATSGPGTPNATIICPQTTDRRTKEVTTQGLGHGRTHSV